MISTTCRCCKKLPGSESLTGLCPDCFYMIHVKQKELAKLEVLKHLSEIQDAIDTAKARHAVAVAGSPARPVRDTRGPTDDRTLYACTCGYSGTVGTVTNHIYTHDNTDREPGDKQHRLVQAVAIGHPLKSARPKGGQSSVRVARPDRDSVTVEDMG